jgi:hypothetical protein
MTRESLFREMRQPFPSGFFFSSYFVYGVVPPSLDDLRQRSPSGERRFPEAPVPTARPASKPATKAETSGCLSTSYSMETSAFTELRTCPSLSPRIWKTGGALVLIKHLNHS